MAQITRIVLPNGQEYVPSDWTSAEPLWSTVEVSPGPFPLLKAFSYGRGASEVPGSIGPRKSSYVDTNLEGEGSKLPENEDLIAYTMNVEVFKIGTADTTTYFPDADQPDVPLPDMLRMQRDIVMLFRIAAIKDYTHASMSYFPAAMGTLYNFSGNLTEVSGGATGTVVASNGSPSPRDVRTFASPLYVAGGEAFGVEVTAGPGFVQGLNLALDNATPPKQPGRIRLRIFLDGLRRRPVA
jgi:hypothetical protein